MISQACTPLGFVSVAVTGTAPVGFTSVIVTGTTTFVIPPTADLVLMVVEGTAVRWRDDGSAPTPTSGFPIYPTSAAGPFEYSGALANIQFTAAAGATVDASFYKTG
jgi:hypothetical protein